MVENLYLYVLGNTVQICVHPRWPRIDWEKSFEKSTQFNFLQWSIYKGFIWHQNLFQIYKNWYKIQMATKIPNGGHFWENEYWFKTQAIYIAAIKSSLNVWSILKSRWYFKGVVVMFNHDLLPNLSVEGTNGG